MNLKQVARIAFDREHRPCTCAACVDRRRAESAKLGRLCDAILNAAIGDRAAAIKLFAAKQGWARKDKIRIGEIEVRATARLGELLKQTRGKGQQGGDRKSSSAKELDPPLALPRPRAGSGNLALPAGGDA